MDVAANTDKSEIIPTMYFEANQTQQTPVKTTLSSRALP